jgi:general L-amino acid transport system substrate-binding protein
MNRFVKFAVGAAAFALAAMPFVGTQAQDGGLLATVKARGNLVCGINNGVPGFGFIDSANNTVSGFDTDFCRVLAAAIFGDASKVEFKPIAAADRFTAIGAGEIDVLIRNTTYTFGRDTQQGAEFGPTLFYDGQALMVRSADNVSSLLDLDGATVCAIKGTTTEQNIADATAGKVTVEVVIFENIDQVIDGFVNERCNAVTSDRSQLTSKKATSEKGGEWVILAETISKEPLAPAWKAGDAQWGDLVRWAVYATIIAEEYGVTSANIAEKLADPALNPEAKRLFSVEGELYKNLGLEANWAVNIVSMVGNYGEIFAKNLGVAPFNFERGLNNLWRNGGLLYAPPYR